MKSEILLIVSVAILLSGINFDWSFCVSNCGYNSVKATISQLNHKICDNGFNPNKKKKC